MKKARPLMLSMGGVLIALTGLIGLITPAWAIAEHPINLMGFADFGLTYVDHEKTGDKKGFDEGQVVLHFTSILSPRLTYFAELSITARALPTATGFDIEMERSILRYDHSDRLKLSFGRYHTPINFWNAAYHHGLWFQTTITRPEMVKFRGSFIPVHFVGGLLEGYLPQEGLNLTYQVGVGNGRSSPIIARGGDSGDVNAAVASLFSVAIRPDHIPHMEFGLSAYNDRMTVNTKEFGEWIGAVRIVRHREDPEVLAEYANFRHKPLSGWASENNPMYYLQMAYRLPDHAKRWKPYYRYESVKISPNDGAFRDSSMQPLPGLIGSTVGIRYDFMESAAIKGEYRRSKFSGFRAANGVFLQVSFIF